MWLARDQSSSQLCCDLSEKREHAALPGRLARDFVSPGYLVHDCCESCTSSLSSDASHPATWISVSCLSSAHFGPSQVVGPRMSQSCGWYPLGQWSGVLSASVRLPCFEKRLASFGSCCCRCPCRAASSSSWSILPPFEFACRPQARRGSRDLATGFGRSK